MSIQAVGTVIGGLVLAAMAKVAGLDEFQGIDWTLYGITLVLFGGPLVALQGYFVWFDRRHPTSSADRVAYLMAQVELLRRGAEYRERQEAEREADPGE